MTNRRSLDELLAGVPTLDDALANMDETQTVTTRRCTLGDAPRRYAPLPASPPPPPPDRTWSEWERVSFDDYCDRLRSRSHEITGSHLVAANVIARAPQGRTPDHGVVPPAMVLVVAATLGALCLMVAFAFFVHAIQTVDRYEVPAARKGR